MRCHNAVWTGADHDRRMVDVVDGRDDCTAVQVSLFTHLDDENKIAFENRVWFGRILPFVLLVYVSLLVESRLGSSELFVTSTLLTD